MAQISSFGALPDPAAQFARIPIKTAVTGQTPASAKTSIITTSGTDEAQASPLQAQLTRLSGVLNSLQSNVTNVRAKYVDALNSVKSGEYKIKPLDISRSIVTDTLADSH